MGKARNRKAETFLVPSAMTPEQFEQILNDVASGQFLTKDACGKLGLSHSAFVHYLKGQPELEIRYNEARRLGGDYYGERVADISRKVLAGLIEPSVARVAMQGFQWSAEKMDPARWGVKAEITGKNGAPIEFINKTNEQLMAEIVDMAQQIGMPVVIDGDFEEVE